MFLTSNNTRELSEALKRRCLYLHIDYPDLEREKEIVLTKVPDITEHLADQVVRIVRSIRQLELKKAPSVSETLDWARTLVLLGIEQHRRRAGQGDAAHPAQVPDATSPRRPRSSPRRQAAKPPAGSRPSGDRRHRRLPTAATGGRCSTLLAGFIQELRAAGLPVSLTENLDAMEAVQHIPLEDREAFKYALAATLVKNNAHWQAFETVFEVYFSLRGRAVQHRRRGRRATRPTLERAAGRSCMQGTRAATARRRRWTA